MPALKHEKSRVRTRRNYCWKNMKSTEKKEIHKKSNRTGLAILTQNKLLIRLQILLTQIKAWNNSSKLKNEIRQRL